MDPLHHLDKLAPEVMKANLMRASLFLAAYELFKIELTEKVRDFIALGGGNPKAELAALAGPDCEPDAVTFKGCCAWWVRDGTLTGDDVTRIRQIKKHRNDLAHELPKVLVDAAFSVRQDLFADLRHYIVRLGRFWGRVAIDADPQFDGRDIPDDEIDTGPAMLVEYMARLVDRPDG